jgi:molybdenum cofactor cytidylyltransferase
VSEGAVVVLAAGASRRLGRPKQLEPWDGTTLVRHAVETALAARLGPVHVVLGAMASEVAEELSYLDVQLVICRKWRDGMGASLARGLSSLREEVSYAALCVCDQPFVTADHLRALVDAMLTRRSSIAASVYDGRLGVPAVLSREIWKELDGTSADAGARELLRRDPFRVARVPLPLGRIDIDTPADVDKLHAMGGASRPSRPAGAMS